MPTSYVGLCQTVENDAADAAAFFCRDTPTMRSADSSFDPQALLMLHAGRGIF